MLDGRDTVAVLADNTGVQQHAPFTEFTDEQWHRLLDINLTGAFLVGRAVARRMTPRGRGKIVNICSLQSEAARPGIAPYSANKGALRMLTEGMCADLGPHGIRVNGIGPGYFATYLNAALVADEDFSAWVRGRTRPAAEERSRTPSAGAPLPRLARLRLRQRPGAVRGRRHALGALSALTGLPASPKSSGTAAAVAMYYALHGSWQSKQR
ncbi:hypothetical protein SUDANB140_06984 [Streptomyces sp. enrichment culture]